MPSGHRGAAPRRPRAGTPRRPVRDLPRPGRPRASYRRVLALPRRRELAFEPGDLDEALRRLVRERLAGRIRRQLLRIEGVLGAPALDDRLAGRERDTNLARDQ